MDGMCICKGRVYVKYLGVCPKYGVWMGECGLRDDVQRWMAGQVAGRVAGREGVRAGGRGSGHYHQ